MTRDRKDKYEMIHGIRGFKLITVMVVTCEWWKLPQLSWENARKIVGEIMAHLRRER